LGSWIPFFLGLVALTVLICRRSCFLGPEVFCGSFLDENHKARMNMGAMVVLVIALLSVVNYLGVKKT
jgi:hypothetical protein